jgi:hypothetical protein
MPFMPSKTQPPSLSESSLGVHLLDGSNEVIARTPSPPGPNIGAAARKRQRGVSSSSGSAAGARPGRVGPPTAACGEDAVVEEGRVCPRFTERPWAQAASKTAELSRAGFGAQPAVHDAAPRRP